MADKRITDVDYIELLDGSESFFVNQNGALKQVNKANMYKDTVFGIENGGLGTTSIDEAREVLGVISMTNTTITLIRNGWENNKQTVYLSSVPEDADDNAVFPSPTSSSRIAYAEYNIACISQAKGSLTFECEEIPSVDINVNIAIFY